MGEPVTVTVDRYELAKEVYRQRDLRQALYDEGEVVMADVLVNLHGDEHRRRRRVENRLFRRETFERYERELFPGVIAETLDPYLAAGRADLVPLGHQLMLNLAALTAGVDRPLRTPEETGRLYDYTMLFIEGATMAHSTLDRPQRRAVIGQALRDWTREFLDPGIARRRDLLARAERGEVDEAAVPPDVLTILLRHERELGLSPEVTARETAFFLLAGAHTSATAFVRATDHILRWVRTHPADRDLLRTDRTFVQRCVHETVRLNPSSPIGMRWALADVTLRDGTRIPAGARVVIDLLAVNRDRSVFGEDADQFDPRRRLPPGVPPFGLSFAAGTHVCIGQDLAAGLVPRDSEAGDGHLFGLVTVAVQRLLDAGVRLDPDDPPTPDTTTRRPYWGRYPVLFGD